ncbi:MAG: hypothetical protein K2R98_20085 [Gemmataceae bacterium]|nr:hypothetical protein [Gemmataceae bacterium]
MAAQRLTTRFAFLPCWLAVSVLGGTGAAIVGCLYAALTAVVVHDGDTLRPIHDGEAFAKSFSDFHFYSDVVQGIHEGIWYYDVLPGLFPKYRYRPFSVFNFRTPTYAWVLGLPPDPLFGRLLLMAIGLATQIMAAVVLARQHGPGAAFAGVSLLAGGLGWCFVPPVFLFAEQWAGALIAFSVFAYALRQWPIGFAAALLALFFRELALLYCVVSLALAWHQGRRIEMIAWLSGFALYGAFMAFHVHQVLPRLPQGAGTGAESWITFGGVTFLLETGMSNFFVALLLPWWSVAMLLPLGLLGLSGARSELGVRCWLTVLLYLAAFCVVGQWFNACWGLLYAPLLSLGLLWAPAALRDLWSAVWRAEPAHQAGGAAEERA